MLFPASTNAFVCKICSHHCRWDDMSDMSRTILLRTIETFNIRQTPCEFWCLSSLEAYRVHTFWLSMQLDMNQRCHSQWAYVAVLLKLVWQKRAVDEAPKMFERLCRDATLQEASRVLCAEPFERKVRNEMSLFGGFRDLCRARRFVEAQCGLWTTRLSTFTVRAATFHPPLKHPKTVCHPFRSIWILRQIEPWFGCQT